LYFSSDRPGGKGSYDIWMTRRLDDSWEKWSNPVNLGDSVNTKEWEAYFSLDAKGEYGFIASANVADGHTDIGRVKLSESQKPNSVALVYGNIINSVTKQPMNAELFYDLIPNENNAGVVVSKFDGKYKLTLPYGNVYSIRASSDKFFSVIDTIDLTTANSYKELHRDLYLTPVVTDGKLIVDDSGNIVRVNLDNEVTIDSSGKIIIINPSKNSIAENNNSDKLNQGINPNNSGNTGNNNSDKSNEGNSQNKSGGSVKVTEGMILTTNNILFDFSKSILRSESYKELDKVAILMKSNKTMQIELSAHTDAIGGYSSNLKLSEDRANASRQYLLSKGIAADRIIAKGYGETTPVASNTTEEGRQLNRRVEFRVLKK
jgi:outer membrane protein OmpA-like peptidoglycan-associated protein